MRVLKYLFELVTALITFLIYLFFDYLINPWLPFGIIFIIIAFTRDGLVENILKDMGYDIIE
uniref:hypothetical protein n=1 Tax=Candidatus Enterococcus willemsii TaxID=1857215 RepID=UPI00403FA130